jgi:hypothetical protein
MVPKKPNPKGGSYVPVITMVKKELFQYKEHNGKYNGLIRIISKPEFLVACYEEIKGKPGNMTPGVDNTTLDGISFS